MATEEIGEINLSNPDWRSSSCMIQVDEYLTMNEEDIVDVGRARIFRVPKPLRDSNDGSYSPYLVSIGPFHYGKEELKDMEKSKSEAVRRMQKRTQRYDPRASIKSFVEKRIVLKDKEIREFYGEYIPFTDIKLAWIVVRDACFLFEFLINYVESSTSIYDEEVDAFSWKYDTVFDVNQNPVRERLMDDLLLLENQIPLWVLNDLLEIQAGFPEAAKEKLDDLMHLLLQRAVTHTPFMWFTAYSSNTSSHVLEVVYRGMVGRNLEDFKDGEALQLSPLSSNRMAICFQKGVDSVKAICGRLRFLSSNTSHGESVKVNFLKMPTALELTRAGVKIHPVKNRPLLSNGRSDDYLSAIRWIRFDEKTSTLYLPQMRVTLRSDSIIMRNIIAMEVIEKWWFTRPMTEFAIFMNELIAMQEDVAVLREAEVINNLLRSDEEVANLFHSLTKGITPGKECRVLVEARMRLCKYTTRSSIKYKILWKEFTSTYFSKPWLVIGSMGAVLLILMTMVQTFCMFYNCYM